ncbi:MAG TPA: hypothetical protein VFU15_09630 [Bacteroidia bacterium]|nr:hypothetical protein [Bacteroidia bacterium]
MNASDDLFRLIHSLSKNEKGYFKKSAGRHVKGNGNNYIRLFDAIEKQNVYDEEKVKRKFSGETFIRHLPSEKNYLYHLILRSLREYHSGSSADARMHQDLHDIELLFDKGLFTQCARLLARVKKHAVKFSKPLLSLHIMEWESRILAAQGKLDELEALLRRSGSERKKHIAEFENTSAFRELEDTMFLVSRKYGFPRTKKDRQRYEKVMKHPLMKNEKNASSYPARLHYYNIHNFYFEATGDAKETYRYRKMLVDFAETDEEQMKDNQYRYVVALNNLMNSQDELGLKKDCDRTIAKLQHFPARSMNIRSRIFGYTFNILFTQCILSGQFEKVIAHEAEVEEGLHLYGKLLHPEFHLAFKYQFFYGSFGAGKFRKSLTWMNRLLEDETLRVRPEVYFFARIMNLIVHFELKNTDFLPYLIRSTYRMLIRQKRLFRFENVVLDFIRKSGNYTTAAEMKSAFLRLKTQLEELNKDPYEKQVLSFFDIIAWLESKITRRSFGEIVRSKN